MEKLELRHLSPYLPYNTLVWYKQDLDLAEFCDTEFEKHTISLNPYNVYSCLSGECKLVLHPLSDLTKEIEHNGEGFVPENFLTEMGHSVLFEKNKFRTDFGSDILSEFPELGKPYKIEWLPYKLYEKLFEWHFDVFNLIDKNLAIDINTL